VENLPSFEVFRFPVCFEQLLELFACQGIRPGVGMLLEDLLKLFRNEPGVVDDIWLEIYILDGQLLDILVFLQKSIKGKTCYSFCNKTCLDRNTYDKLQ
jgi:hypothetical protein